jgi:hypothetical protein
MRNALVILAAFCVSGALVACNSESKPNPVGHPTDKRKDQQSALGWTLKYQAKCPEEIDASACIGAFGFAIEKNGDYTVGPDQKGQIRSGKLSEAEISSIASTLNSTISQSSARAEAHETIEEPTENEITISFMRGNGAPENLVKTAGTDFYYQTQSFEEAKSLLTAVSNLATQYASNFPDNCKDGAMALQLLMNDVQKCNVDSDCAYLDSSFGVLAADSNETVVTDDCSIVKPLVLGNAELVRASASKITESLDAVRGACGDKMIREEEGCTMKTLNLSGAKPSCDGGMCKLPAQ